MKTIIDFYTGKQMANTGETIDEILKFNDFDLESEHQYIQWLFPLREPSPVNPHAPLFDGPADYHLSKEPDGKLAEENFLKALSMMNKFYNFDSPTKQQWVSIANHNYLRLTRIIKSAILMGYPEYAEHFALKAMATYSKYPADVGLRSLGFWVEAVALHKIHAECIYVTSSSEMF